MAPFIVVAIVAGSLFGTGAVVKPEHPVLGNALEFAGVGTLVGGALGAAAGTASGTASVLGVSTTNVVTAASVTGGVTGTVVGAYFAPKPKKKEWYNILSN